jgi:uncharacterized DUF497 family protein
MHCIYNGIAVFDWDESNLRKIRAHRIKPADVEQALSNSPILIYEQDVAGELRYVYYGETDSGRLLAAVIIERGERIRVVTAYGLDAGQKRDYLVRRMRGE